MLNNPFSRKSAQPRLNLVVGLNQVDKIPPQDWNERLNLPSPAQEVQIERRCKDIIAKLSGQTGLREEQIEFYSATRRYRLLPLLASVIRHCKAGFRLEHVQPADPFDLANPEARAYAARKRREMAGAATAKGSGDLLAELRKLLSGEDLARLEGQLVQERRRPPKVALFGKAGVGKTSTINSLFAARWKVSHTLVGTTGPQVKEFELESGGSLKVIDLPGYGRSVRDDEAYEAAYRDLIPTCDLVMLVLQANSRDFSDDQEMIGKLTDWLKAASSEDLQ